MFGIRRKKRIIAGLVLRCEAERALLQHDLRVVAPGAKAAAGVGIGLLVAKKAKPFLRPVAFGLIQRFLAKRNHGLLVKLAGVLSFVVGMILRAKKS